MFTANVPVFFLLRGGVGWPRLVKRGRGVSRPPGHAVGWVCRWVTHGGSGVVVAHELASRVGGVPTAVGYDAHPSLSPLLSPHPGDADVEGVRTPESMVSGGCRTPELKSVTHRSPGGHYEH